MSGEVIIKAKNLSKTFKLYLSPKHRLLEMIHPFKKKYHNMFRALSDVSFEISKGESIGILGKNGAGKSTLLKILTGVQIPSKGSIEVKGRIAALLELGAGFNPSISGRDNIYFQGAILGFSEKEMDEKVSEIIAFADIGEHIDQPVKTYSSGMFARLAFSIAIHVDPDILIIDEALGVGDVRFQQKCIKKMKQFLGTKTVLFVSHDLSLMKNFCSRLIWLEKGKIEQVGSVEEVCRDYYSYMTYGHKQSLPSTVSLEEEIKIEDYLLLKTFDVHCFGERKAYIDSFGIFKNGLPATAFFWGDTIEIVMVIENPLNIDELGIGVMLKDKLDREMFTFNTYIMAIEIDSKYKRFLASIKFEAPYIMPGEYTLVLALSEGTLESHLQQHWLNIPSNIQIESIDMYGTLGCLLRVPQEKISIETRRLL